VHAEHLGAASLAQDLVGVVAAAAFGGSGKGRVCGLVRLRHGGIIPVEENALGASEAE
jgi:hypothetical protein